MHNDSEDYLEHYGTPRHSGRYPWGSGGWGANDDKAYIPRDNASIMDFLKKLRSQGLTETQIAQGFGMTTTELRAAKSNARAAVIADQIRLAESLRAKGLSTTAIAERMGIPEPTVRNRLKPGESMKADKVQQLANLLRKEVDARSMIMVGEGVDTHLGVSRERLRTAIAILEAEGYNLHSGIKVEQLGAPGNFTTLKVLTKPEIGWGDAAKNKFDIQNINEQLSETGKGSFGIFKPISIDKSRLDVVYGPEGGAERDGLMYIRPGAQDLSMGGVNYAQVRIQVGDGHYLKGMAVYSDKLPAGVDIQFHTNKNRTANKLDALKKIEPDPDNPFGSTIRKQLVRLDSDGKEQNMSAVNFVNWEGEWGNWSKTLASQVLGKQDLKVAREQLKMAREAKENQFDTIMSMTNPVVKQKLLQELADSSDSAAVHLKAAALPRQAWHTILPIRSLKDNEVYAPNFDNGDEVVLIRYPHGGTFEIPKLVVNNKNREAQSIIKSDAPDAVGINAKVAERLSGADFDGDTVLVIPNKAGKIRSTAPLEGLKDFNPREQYRGYEGMKVMSSSGTQLEMGKASNLVTDMTLRGASSKDLARAVRHSMVVIDAERHKLNYKQSEIDNGIKDLRRKYQYDPATEKVGGASTLLSRAKSASYPAELKLRSHAEGGPIDKATGELVYVPTGRVSYKTGKLATPKRDAMELTKDAHTLSTGTPMERLYGDHANSMKALANKARKEMVAMESPRLSPPARQKYKAEVESLNAKLTAVQLNAPLERRAQLIGNAVVTAKRQANPGMDRATQRKISFAALEDARERTGAAKVKIKITDSEWEAIQANAIGGTKLRKLLNAADMDVVKEHATPKNKKLMTSAKTRKAEALLAAGYTRAQVADQLGVSLTTLGDSVGAVLK